MVVKNRLVLLFADCYTSVSFLVGKHWFVVPFADRKTLVCSPPCWSLDVGLQPSLLVARHKFVALFAGR